MFSDNTLKSFLITCLNKQSEHILWSHRLLIITVIVKQMYRLSERKKSQLCPFCFFIILVIETQVEVWENEKCCWLLAPVSTAFSSSPYKLPCGSIKQLHYELNISIT